MPNAEPKKYESRSCSICFAYAPVVEMIQKTDGRVICEKCDRRIDKLTAKRAQLDLFGQQSLLT
jgi:hypothetical protein